MTYLIQCSGGVFVRIEGIEVLVSEIRGTGELLGSA